MNPFLFSFFIKNYINLWGYFWDDNVGWGITNFGALGRLSEFNGNGGFLFLLLGCEEVHRT